MFSPGLGGWFRPMGRDRTLGSNSSTLLPYERGASANGLGSDEAVAPRTVLSVVFEAAALGGLFGLGFSRRGYVVTKVRHWHNKQVLSGLLEGLKSGGAKVLLSIVRDVSAFGRELARDELQLEGGGRLRSSLIKPALGNFGRPSC